MLLALVLVLAAAHSFTPADPFDGVCSDGVGVQARLLVPELDGGTVWVRRLRTRSRTRHRERRRMATGATARGVRPQ